MEKEKVSYRFNRYSGKMIYARREISYEIQLVARLMLDELCFNWNKNRLLENIDRAFEEENKEKFLLISEKYKQYVWE